MAAIKDMAEAAITDTKRTWGKFRILSPLSFSSTAHNITCKTAVTMAAPILAAKICFRETGEAISVSKVLFSNSSATVSIIMLPAIRAGNSIRTGMIIE